MSSKKNDNADADVDPYLVMDRIVTATTLPSLVQGLLGLREYLRNDSTAHLPSDEIDALWKALVGVLQGTHAACASATQMDEAVQNTLRLYGQLAPTYAKAWVSSNKNNEDNFLSSSSSSSSSWMQAVVDVATSSAFASYTRVLAVQRIVQVAKLQPKKTQQALLETPQAVSRLAEMLTGNSQDNEPVVIDEQVVDVCLRELAPIVAAWPAAARMWVFVEVPQFVLRRIVREYFDADATPAAAASAARDGLQLIQTLLSHDAQLVSLVTSTATDWFPLLAQFLDLRQARAYRYPSEAAAAAAKKSPQLSTQVDDLDDLLGSGSKTSKEKQHTDDDDELSIPIPRLSTSEEEVIQQVLDLLRALLSHEDVRRSVWHGQTRLVHLIWDWACMGPPPPAKIVASPAYGGKYPCAYGSVSLQLQVLDLVADCFGDAQFLLPFRDGASGYFDGCMYLVCTGGPGTKRAEKLQISQAAVAVLRNCGVGQSDGPLSATECVLAALQPAQEEEPAAVDEADRTLKTQQHAKRVVLLKLLQTVQEQLPPPPDDDDSNSYDDVTLLGAVSALALLAGTTEAEKSLLLKWTGDDFLAHVHGRMAWQLERLVQHDETDDSLTPPSVALAALWRLVGIWTSRAPLVLQAFWSHGQAAENLKACLTLGTTKGMDADEASTNIQSLASLVAGQLLCVDDDNLDLGGWTRETVVQLLVGNNLQARLQQWKTLTHSSASSKSRSVSTWPWMLNRIERKAFLKWHEITVSSVRQALVQYVMVGGNKGCGVASDGGGTDANDAPVDPLQTLVAQQAEELETLQKQYQESQAKVQAQEKQLSVWKQRVESTPTELDEMLSNYAKETGTLEETICQLRADLAERDEQLAKSQDQVKNLEEDKQLLEQDLTAVQEEMTALSSTYGNLEDEYRRLEEQQRQAVAQDRSQQTQPEPSTAAGEDPSAEANINAVSATNAAQQPQGENPDQAAGSTEVATLRAENNRLRDDARAADDWMRMAVDRMNSQRALLSQTQQRLAELEGQLAQGAVTVSEGMSAEWQRREQELLKALELAQQSQGKMQAEIDGLQQQVASKFQQSSGSEQALERAHNELNVLKQELALMQSRNDDMACEDSRTLDAMKAKGDEVSAELVSARALIDKLQLENQSLKTRANELEGQLVALSTTPAPQSLDTSETEGLRAELDRFRANMEHTNEAHRAQILEKEDRIRILEEQLAAAETSSSIEPADKIMALEEEIKQLQENNEAAQQWMAQAVEHHQTLADQIAKLQEENATLQQHVQSSPVDQAADNTTSLREEIETLRQEKAFAEKRVEDAELKYEDIKSDLAVLTHEHEDLLEELARLEERVQTVGESPDESRTVSELQQKLAAVENERDKREQEASELRSRCADLETQHIEVEKKLQSLVKSGISTEKESENSRAEIDSLKKRLEDEAAEADNAISQWQASYNALQEQYAALQSQLSAGDDSGHEQSLQAEIDRLLKELEVERTEADGVLSQWQESYNNLQEQYDALRTQSGERPPAGPEVEELQAEVDDLKNSLDEEAADAEKAILEWQTSYSDLQEKYDALQSQASALGAMGDPSTTDESHGVIENLRKELADQKSEADEAISQWEASYKELESKFESLQSQNAAPSAESSIVDEKQAVIDSLQKQLDEEMAGSDAALSQWQEAYNDLQEQYELLKNQAGTERVDKDDSASSDLRRELEKVSKELEKQKEEAESAISQWQSSFDDLQERYDDLKAEHKLCGGVQSPDVSRLEDDVVELKKEIEAAEQVISDWEGSYDALKIKYDALVMEQPEAGLRSEIEYLRKQIENDATDAESAIGQWQESYTAVEAENEELRIKLQELSNRPSSVSGAPLPALNMDYDVSRLRSEADEACRVLGEYKNKCKTLEAELNTSRDENASLSEEIGNLKSKLDLESREAEEAISQWQHSYESLQKELQSLTEKKREAEEATTQWQDSYETLENELQVLRDKDREADDAISQWQDSYESVEKELQMSREKNANLEESLSSSISKRNELSNRATELEAELAHQTELAGQLSKELSDIRQQNEATSSEAQAVIKQWEERFNSVQAELKTVASNRDDLQARVSELSDSLDEQGSKDTVIAELQAQIETLEKRIVEESREADDAISQWQDSYEALQESQNVIASELAVAREHESELTSKLEQLEEQLEHMKSASEKVEALQQEITAQSSKHQDEVSSLQTQLYSLQSTRDVLSAEKSSLLDKMKDYEQRLTSHSTNASSDSETAKLLDEIERLKQLREEDAVEAENAVREWEESYLSQEATLQKALVDLTEAQETIDSLTADRDNALAKHSSDDADRIAFPLSDNVEDLKAELARQQQQHDAEIREADDAWQQSYDSLQSNLARVTSELDKANWHIQELMTEKEGSDEKIVVEKLREELALLHEHLDQQSRDADEAVTQWQESYEALEAELANTREEVDAASRLKEEWRAEVEGLQKRLGELESATERSTGFVETLQLQLEEATVRAHDAEQLLDKAQAEHANQVAKQDARIRTLEEHTRNLNESADTTDREGETIVAVTKPIDGDATFSRDGRSLDALQQDNDYLSKELESLREIVQTLQEDLDRETALRNKSEREMDASEEIVNSWKDRVEDLESAEQELKGELDQLKEELEQQRIEAEEAIAMWEHQCHDLEAQLEETMQDQSGSPDIAELQAELDRIKEANSKLMEQSTGSPKESASNDSVKLVSELEQEREARMTAEEKIEALEKKINETKTTFTERIEIMQAEQARTKTAEETQRLHDRERTDDLERRNDELRNEKSAVEADVQKLTVRLAEQATEMRELDNMIKRYKTNEISHRAVQVAGDALKAEVASLRQQLDDVSRAVEGEKTSRLAAEQEARRVLSDLAALLGLENSEENQSEIRRRAMEATEHFQRKEQAEIEELRESLNVALEKLDKSRHEAQKAENRALNAELQFSNAEDDISAARREVKAMVISIEETRDAEASRRSSFEARIAGLETDQINLRRFHASEMESIRSELNSVTMERDQLRMSLREAQSSKDAVLKTVSAEPVSLTLDTEIRRLRLENASLLAQTAEETARTERRIREAREADRSANHTQILVERELRLAAERALDAAHEDLTRARQQGLSEHPSSKDRMAELTRELGDSRDSNAKLSDQLAEIRRQLEQLRRDSRHEIDELKEECRQAKNRASQLEQEGRFEAEVRAEVARIQSSPSRGGCNNGDTNSRALVVVHAENKERKDNEDKVTVARLYDVVEKQREQIEEERKVHMEQKQDFDDLLALLTQHSLQKDALIEALLSVSGQEAVDAALEKADRDAEEEYGKLVVAE